VRQPGFDHHAHEIVIENQSQLPSQSQLSQQHGHKQQQTTNEKLNSLKNFIINYDNKSNRNGGSGGLSNVTKTKKTAADSYNLLSGVVHHKPTTTAATAETSSGGKTTNKAKKKLCTMNTDDIQMDEKQTQPQQQSVNNSCLLVTDQQNVQLKPISSKAKREPLPMRLRALPSSFWQQPNQPNISPSTMYLPPLFKNEIDNVNDGKLLGHFIHHLPNYLAKGLFISFKTKLS
jgi:hypothetical protein